MIYTVSGRGASGKTLYLAQIAKQALDRGDYVTGNLLMDGVVESHELIDLQRLRINRNNKPATIIYDCCEMVLAPRSEAARARMRLLSLAHQDEWNDDPVDCYLSSQYWGGLDDVPREWTDGRCLTTCYSRERQTVTIRRGAAIHQVFDAPTMYGYVKIPHELSDFPPGLKTRGPV